MDLFKNKLIHESVITIKELKSIVYLGYPRLDCNNLLTKFITNSEIKFLIANAGEEMSKKELHPFKSMPLGHLVYSKSPFKSYIIVFVKEQSLQIFIYLFGIQQFKNQLQDGEAQNLA